VPYDETPTYVKPQPNGLVEVEHAVNCAFNDLGYGQTILLLQGWPFDSTVWEPLPTVLASDRRVVIFDPRGLGGSDRPWDFYTIPMLANDLHRLIVEQSLRDITLVAWSFAAPVALHYANQHQDRLERIVLLNPLIPAWLGGHDDSSVGYGPNRAGNQDQAQPENGDLQIGEHRNVQTKMLSTWAEALLDDRANFMEHFVDRLTHHALSNPRRHWLWQRLMSGAHHAQVKMWEALLSEDPADWLQDLSLPVTILSGEHDHLATPAQAQRLTELLPRSQCLTVPGAGHAVFIDARDAVVQAIRDLTTVPEYEYSPANDVDGEITDSNADNADVADDDDTDEQIEKDEDIGTGDGATDGQIAGEVATATSGHNGNTDNADNADVTDG
jgi:pimeloyl-ACP methyl ester carboxylesterase